MWDIRLKRVGLAVLLVALLLSGDSVKVFATTASSPSYEISETEFGAGATLESCSGQYCAKATIGNLTGDDGSSPSSTATFGPIASDSEPLLEVIVEDGASNLGVLSTEKTAHKTMNVSVRSYLSNGYTLQIIGKPPIYGTHQLAVPSSPTASSPGNEQFAINLAANTDPELGAEPEQYPSSEFSYGVVEENYARPNLYMYSSGDVVARSYSESGQTRYTVSMIVNVSGSTPAGHYSGDYSAMVVPVF